MARSALTALFLELWWRRDDLAVQTSNQTESRRGGQRLKVDVPGFLLWLVLFVQITEVVEQLPAANAPHDTINDA